MNLKKAKKLRRQADRVSTGMEYANYVLFQHDKSIRLGDCTKKIYRMLKKRNQP